MAININNASNYCYQAAELLILSYRYLLILQIDLLPLFVVCRLRANLLNNLMVRLRHVSFLHDNSNFLKLYKHAGSVRFGTEMVHVDIENRMSSLQNLWVRCEKREGRD